MATAPPPVSNKPSLPPPPTNRSSSAPALATPNKFNVESGRAVAAQKIVVYGPGGIGKSELCSLLAKVGVRPFFIDVGNSSLFLDVKRINSRELTTWEALRAAVQSDWPQEGIVLDDLTKSQELAEDFVIRTVKHEKGKPITSIEDYGYGKGSTHVYEVFLTLLGDLDSQVRRGKHVICTAHECTAKVPNPAGENWIRYEPRLQSPESGKNSIRHRVKEWCDHLLFIGYDVAVSEGKGQGAGTRTIYPCELPICMAKSRQLADPIVYEQGNPILWNQLLGNYPFDSSGLVTIF